VNFKKLYWLALVFFLITVFQGNASAATIHGTIYQWNSFKPLNNSVVEINSIPGQNHIAANSEYSFNLTPGNYTINASYLDGNKVIYTAREEVVISDEGEYVLDLLLFPPSHEELLNQDNLEGPDLYYEEMGVTSRAGSQYIVLVSAFLALIVLLLAGYILKKKHDKSTTILFTQEEREPYLLEPENPIKDAVFSEDTETHSAENIIGISELSYEQFDKKSESASDSDKTIHQRGNYTEEANGLPGSSFHEKEPNKSSSDASKHSKINLPEDLKELLDMIRDSGNRITQRELRKKSPYSESKVSLMLSDLEERGLIEKFKRGRGNIIRIPDVHIPRQTKNESKKE
jgi:uncharacterized membrane protein